VSEPLSVENLARYMYVRNVSAYDADPAKLDDMWAIESVRAFWMNEAQHVLDFIFGKGTF